MVDHQSSALGEIEDYQNIYRFVSSLSGTSPLELETQEAVRGVEARLNEERFARLYALIDDQDGTDRGCFNAAEYAREQLRENCRRVVDSANAKKNWTTRWFRKSARENTKEFFKKQYSEGTLLHSIEEIKDDVKSIERYWQARHGKKPDRKIFKLFPNDTIYTSAVCGGVAMAVQAAVAHEETAQLLSSRLENVSEKVIQLESWLESVKTKRMKICLAEIYKHFFNLLSTILNWYFDSRFSRFLQSFNQDGDQRLRTTAEAIDNQIKIMNDEGHIGISAMQRMGLYGMAKLNHQQAIMNNRMSNLESMLRRDKADIQSVATEIRRDRSTYGQLNDQTGILMMITLKAHQQEMDRQIKCKENGVNDRKELIEQAFDGQRDDQSSRIVRPVSSESLSHIQNHIVGSDGTDLLSQGQGWLLEHDMLDRLHTWLAATDGPQLLWIECPFETQSESASRMAALAITAASIQIRAKFISHFCQKPRVTELDEDLSPEKAGLIGLVYDLIYQLLSFQPSQGEPLLSSERLKQLDGRLGSWNKSLSLLSDLLDYTPQVAYCVIDGLNLFETKDDLEWCQQFPDKVGFYRAIHQQGRITNQNKVRSTSRKEGKIRPFFIE
ncbi:MAG: hypothetical protein Q9227_007799 [Pyrenula ochraceoflavens]